MVSDNKNEWIYSLVIYLFCFGLSRLIQFEVCIG